MRPGRPERSEDDCKEALRAAADELRDVPSLEAYKIIRADLYPAWPSHMTIMRRFGGWNQALESVGLVPTKRWRTRGSSQQARRMASSIKDMYWLAGWLEGEGTFRAEVEDDKYARFHIVVHSVDEDVVRQAEQIAGYVTGPFGPYPGTNRQPYWIWQEKQRDKVFELVSSLYPLMGLRRKKQMDKMLAVSKAHPAKYTGKRTVRRKRGS